MESGTCCSRPILTHLNGYGPLVVCLLSWLRLLRFLPTVCIVRPTHHSPFDVLRTSLTPLQPGFVSASPTWQHVYRRVLRELDIEFEPSSQRTWKFLHSLQLSWKLAAENANSCSCASSACAIATKSPRIAYGTWTRQLCASFHQASVGWTKKGESAHVFASRAFVTVTLAAHMRSGKWTTLSAPAHDPLSDALDHEGRSPGHDGRD